MFHNAPEYRLLYPDAAAGKAVYYAPRIECGFQLEAIVQRLAARGRLLQDDGRTSALGPLVGSFDQLTPLTILGWARNPDAPERPVDLMILDNGVVIAEVSAGDYRADLEEAGLGDGRHGFSVTIPAGLSSFSQHVVRVLRRGDGVELPGSPMILEAAIAPPYRKAA
jgi:hypothetical protein